MEASDKEKQMSLEIQRKKDGSVRSKWWYGQFSANGKSRCVNLDVKIEDSIPTPAGAL